MKKALVFISAIYLVFTSGCTSLMTKSNSYFYDVLGGYHYYKDYTVEIISEPSGAKIELNGDYVGETPLTRIYNGNFSNSSTIVVKAYPISLGQHVQTKILWGDKPLPKTIYFNMNLVPTDRDYNINLR